MNTNEQNYAQTFERDGKLRQNLTVESEYVTKILLTALLAESI